MTFKEQIIQNPRYITASKTFDTFIIHAPKRKEILSLDEKKLALRNALRYFDSKHNAKLIPNSNPN
jgi:urocanate hydratase